MEAGRRPWVTLTLVVANIAVFVWSVTAGADALRPTPQWMLEHGGNYGPLTFSGEPWRLFTSMFLHYGVLHLGMNMIGLGDGGRHVERMYGSAGFAALYIVSGLAGSLASALRGHSVSVGASGAIFGIFGAFGAFLFLHRSRLDREVVARQARGLLIFLAYNAYFGLAVKGIDLVAHLGGLVAGFACGIALELGTDEKPSTTLRSLLVAVLGTALVIGTALAVHGPKDAMRAFGPVEAKALATWNDLVKQAQAGTISDEKLAETIENDILPAWREAHAAYARDADDSLRAEMLEYMTAREEGWSLMASGLRAHDDALAKRGLDRFGEADALLRRLSPPSP